MVERRIEGKGVMPAPLNLSLDNMYWTPDAESTQRIISGDNTPVQSAYPTPFQMRSLPGGSTTYSGLPGHPHQGQT